VTHVALGGKIIKFLWLDSPDEALEACFVKEITIMQKQACAKDVSLVCKMIKA